MPFLFFIIFNCQSKQLTLIVQGRRTRGKPEGRRATRNPRLTTSWGVGNWGCSDPPRGQEYQHTMWGFIRQRKKRLQSRGIECWKKGAWHLRYRVYTDDASAPCGGICCSHFPTTKVTQGIGIFFLIKTFVSNLI